MAATVAIVGGGISGLALAFELRERARGRPDAPEVVCLEAADVPGGNVRTERAGGFTCEWGPNGFLDNSPATPDLVRRLGIAGRLQPADEAAAERFLWRRGRLHAVPMGPGAFLGSRMLTAGEKLRLACEGLQPARRADGDESIFDFAARRIGRGAASVMVDAMVSGIYAGDSRALSLPATFPKMAAMEREHGSLTRAMLARRKTARDVAGPGRGRLTSFAGGMGDLVDALAAALGDALRTGSPAAALRRAPGGGWRVALEDGAEVEAERVALMLPAWHAARVVGSLDPELSAVLAEIPSAPVVVCHVGMRREDLARSPRGFGFLVPRGEGLRLLGVLFASTIFPGRAPAGHALFTCMLGGARDPESVALPDGAVLDLVRRELERTLGITAEPMLTRIFRHPRGIPQYTLGHLERLARIDAALTRHPGLLVGGNSYRGISANDCIRNAIPLAERMLETGTGT